jgi:3-hydroxyacyl-[acyl-carrier-protein] dehydratase
MLLDDFYTIIQQSEITDADNKADFPLRKFNFTIKLNPRHPVYTGHFPGNPVTPGVCQVQIIKELTSAAVNMGLVIHRSDNIKFLSMILPSDNHFLTINLETREKEPGFWNVSGVISDEVRVYLKFRGLMGKA